MTENYHERPDEFINGYRDFKYSTCPSAHDSDSTITAQKVWKREFIYQITPRPGKRRIHLPFPVLGPKGEYFYKQRKLSQWRSVNIFLIFLVIVRFG